MKKTPWYRTFFLLIGTFIYYMFRPLAGVNNVCIFPVQCGNYAQVILKTRPLLIALVLISWRLLCCNPLTALFLQLKHKRLK